MLKQLLLTTALAALVAGPALAQDTTTEPGQSPTVQTPPAPTAQDQAAPAAPSGEPAVPPTDTATQEQVTPPPADAIMPVETASDMRADKLIGTSVYNPEGEEVGSVQDIVFDQDGKIVGVVLKVGGLLGIGGKSVGIKWQEVEVMPQEDIVKVNYTEDQLKVAPDFMTQDAIAAEQELERSQQQQPLAPAAPTSTQ